MASRKVIWLKAAYTRSNPHVTGGYFMEALEQFGGCHWILRTDLGTENVVVRDIQTHLHCSDGDSRSSEQSYFAEAITTNWRIESSWEILRKEGMECWIQLLCKMEDEGLFVGDYLDKSLVQLCFSEYYLGEIEERLWLISITLPSLEQNDECVVLKHKH